MAIQPFDLTTLRAVHHDLTQHWVPARLETIVQTDLWTIHLALRTLTNRGWLTLSWHPQAARLYQGSPPPKQPDHFQWSHTLQRLKGLALVDMVHRDPWERVLEWQWAARPGDPIRWRLYLELMGQYSNVVLVDADGVIVACGHGVSERQSRVRPVQPGLLYQPPPALWEGIPQRAESQADWHERVSLLPGLVAQRLVKSYRGVSRVLATTLVSMAAINPDRDVETLTSQEWQALYQVWQQWLIGLETHRVTPVETQSGYNLLGWQGIQTLPLHSLLEHYYTDHLNREIFQRERQQIQQKLSTVLAKRYQRRDDFQTMITQAADADEWKAQADLLMAYAHWGEPGLKALTVPDFVTGDPVTIPLNPEKNIMANAEILYRRHRKQKRATQAVVPLLQQVNQEIHYLEQVEAALQDLEAYQQPSDLDTLRQMDQELIAQHYGSTSHQTPTPPTTPFRIVYTPRGIPVWIGRNNLQNDALTRAAHDTDWWFHAQEIPGSHVVLKLEPGQLAEADDLQCAADLAAHFSRAKHSEQVPVVYTKPQHVYKPKGVPPGLVVYKHEKVLWGSPTHPRLMALLHALPSFAAGTAGSRLQ